MKIASIDIGLKRIGVALYLNNIILPQEAIIRKNRNQASRDVSQFLREYKIDTLIIGIPIGGASEEDMRKRVKHFSSLLDFNGEIHFHDESYTSFEAKEMTHGVIKQKRDGRLDSISAKLILQRWIEECYNFSKTLQS